MTDPERMSDERWEEILQLVRDHDGMEFIGLPLRLYHALYDLVPEAKRAREREDKLLEDAGVQELLMKASKNAIDLAAENATLRDRLDSQDFDALHKANETIAKLRAEDERLEKEILALDSKPKGKALQEIKDAIDILNGALDDLEGVDFD